MFSVMVAGFTGLVSSTPLQDSEQGHLWSVHGSYTQSASQTILDQPYEPKQTTFTVQRRIADSHVGAGHEYRVLDLPSVNGVKADANGDLHRLGLGFRQDTQQRRYRLAIGLAVSSNALKNLDDLGSDDVRAAGAIEQRVSERWWLALRVDDRFGRFRLYPGVEWVLQPAPAHQLRIGFPESSWEWQWTPQLQSEVAVAPDGGRWRVRDADFDERRSIVRQNSWQATWTVRWRPRDFFAVEARVGRTFDTTLRYQLVDGTQARVDPPDANFAGVAASVRF